MLRARGLSGADVAPPPPVGYDEAVAWPPTPWTAAATLSTVSPPTISDDVPVVVHMSLALPFQLVSNNSTAALRAHGHNAATAAAIRDASERRASSGLNSDAVSTFVGGIALHVSVPRDLLSGEFAAGA